jgi:drug/metabolite transporter (DMT)-like permease
MGHRELGIGHRASSIGNWELVTNDNCQLSTDFMGELAALGAAFVWALSSTIWQRVGKIFEIAITLLPAAAAICC